MEELDRGASASIDKYDSLLHDYNGEATFQAESQMIKASRGLSRENGRQAGRKNPANLPEPVHSFIQRAQRVKNGVSQDEKLGRTAENII